jgi:hypothetical protein
MACSGKILTLETFDHLQGMLKRKILIIIVVALLISSSWFIFKPGQKIDFSTQVKPILNSKCISCHGGVKAKAGFSVLFREEAFAKTESGKPAIIPGDAGSSEMIRRITHSDPEERMPYKHEPLSSREIKILKQWIDQGAKWGDHWAYLPVKQVVVADVEGSINNDIDKFILEKLEKEKLKQSAPASKEVILRRASLDLIGTLPPESIAKQFLADNNYEKLIDSLLASPQFGERWASVWLDLARYADTKGYEKDLGRDIWKYRDWVIRAFNDDKPYNRFLTEQIAGDLLPNPTTTDYIATGFHRNSMTNDEGGTDNEEFRTAAVIDRVNTTWESLMGTTFSCVQCHSHPYDPFKHDEYYKFLAFFNNTRDEDSDGDYPLLRDFDDTLQNEFIALSSWVKKNAPADEAKKVDLMLRTLQPAIYSFTADSLHGAVIANNMGDLMMRSKADARLKNVNLDHVNRMVYRYITYNKHGILKLHLDSPGSPAIATIRPQQMDQWKWTNAVIDFPEQKGVHDVYLTYYNPDPPKNKDDYRIFFNWFAFTTELPGKEAPGYEEKDKLYKQLITAEIPGTPVMVENDKAMLRKSFVFERGNWRIKGKEVTPAVPNTLAFAMPANAPTNRMGLAMWMTDKRNPLVSRTLVNRLWEQLFGAGIVETLEDMGTQGINPTHKELLDYLSWKLMNDHNWSVKKLLKEIVMSYTYRQDSKLSDEGKEKDLYNKLYARGPRIRLSAEQLRDQHLHISGMLSNRMYGPGVMPWQPDGIWHSPYNYEKWKTDTTENRYRRAIYTYWKRSSPYPSMIAFDGAQRNVCMARRIRTNTPLQALVTLNDSVYVDLARQFAKRMQKEGGKTPEQQIAKGYELMLYKPIKPEKLKLFVDLYHKAGATDSSMNIVANAMLNLDEVVMKN